jgi:hypothetical protein
MARRSSKTLRISALITALIIVAAAISIPKLRKESSLDAGLNLAEQFKRGNAAFLILGDFFHEAFQNELGNVLLELPPGCKTYITCPEKLERSIQAWTAQQQLVSPEIHTASSAAPIMRVWARDVFLSAIGKDRTTVVVAPNMHARSEAEAKTFYATAKELFPQDLELVFAPFAFEGGNLIFIERAGRRILLVGKKIIFDNVRYQNNLWAPGWSTDKLLEKMKAFFRADSVVVLGTAEQPPPAEIYFERRLDMEMAMLGGDVAVVAQFPFGDAERRELRDAIESGDPLIASLFEQERSHDEEFELLSRRLSFVSAEYDSDAGIVAALGLTVHRSPTSWRHVAAWMSWTSVFETTGRRLFFPVYPDPAIAAVRTVKDEQGRITRELQPDALADEKFELEGYNLLNHDLYVNLGYQLVPIPEYLHHVGGGLHSFVNILY